MKNPVLKNQIAWVVITIMVLLTHQSIAQTIFGTNWTDVYTHTPASGYVNQGRDIVTGSNGFTYTLSDVTSDLDPQGNPTSGTFSYTVINKYNATGALVGSYSLEVNSHYVDGYKHTSGYGIGIDANNNLYVGYNYVDPISGSDIRLACFDMNLSLIGIYKFFSTGQEYGLKMHISSTGKIFISGKTVAGNSTTHGIYIYNQVNGDIENLFMFDTNLDIVSDITSDGQNNVYVTGTRISSGVKTIMTASVGLTGNLRWKSISNGGTANRDDYGRSLIIGQDGSLYVTGSSDQGAAAGNSNFDVVVIKHYPVTGKKYWEKYFNNSTNDQGYYIASYSPAFVLASSVSANRTVILHRIRTSDGSLDGRGYYTPKPDVTYLTVDTVTVTEFKVSANQKVYVSGTVTSQDYNNIHFNSSYLVKFNVNVGSRSGFVLVERSLVEGEDLNNFSSVGFDLHPTSNSINWLRDNYSEYLTHDKQFIYTSSLNSSSPVRLGESNDGNKDLSSLLLHISPNPSNGIITLEASMEISKVTIYNIQGKMINFFEHAGEENTIKLDFTTLDSGIYYLEVRSGNGAQTISKFIKTQN